MKLKFITVLITSVALAVVGMAPSQANIRPVEEAPLYEAPEGSSGAVITNGGRIIGDYFAWGDDVAFAIVDGVADRANYDETDVGFDLGFNINFFGKTYDKVFVNTNGFITFEGASSEYGYSLSNLIASVCDEVFDGVCPEGGATGIAAFSPDLYQHGDRDGVTRGMYFGQATLPSGNQGFVITYSGTTQCCSRPVHDPTGSYFQLVIESLGSGDFQVMFNYDYISEDTAEAWTQTDEEEFGGVDGVGRPVAGFGIVRALDPEKDAGDPDWASDAEIYEIFTDLLMTQIASTAENIAAGTALSTLSRGSSVPGRVVLFMKGGQASREESGKDTAFWNSVESCRLSMARSLSAGSDVSTSTYQSCFFTGVNSSNAAAVNAALKDQLARAAASGTAMSHADLMKAAAQIADRLDLIQRLSTGKLVYAAEFAEVGIDLGANPTKTLDLLKSLPSGEIDTLAELLAQIAKLR